MHERDNQTLLTLSGFGTDKALPDDTIWKDCLVCWKDDIGRALAADIGEKDWQALRQNPEPKVSDVGDLHKNIAFIGNLLASAWDSGTKDPSLDQLCELILAFARIQRASKKTARAGQDTKS